VSVLITECWVLQLPHRGFGDQYPHAQRLSSRALIGTIMGRSGSLPYLPLPKFV
jgi:hypothetical protein